ncbi:MAG TPA: 16S rRNA (guanine(966)-N(2))-methyltransferase RsmD [Polyangiaceae bacterium]|nr:16S rRNA (guanine(966)-N(2))-methyltransferase RsmD [Polyangiaceae bacterium]
MSVRVIAGDLRSRELRVPAGLATRPTAARVRQAVFSMLRDVSALHVLDLYAGSGALGIEALSRGAESAVFVERDRAALDCIRANVAKLGLAERATVLPVRVEQASAALSVVARFDLVFCDPPWSEVQQVTQVLARLRPLFKSDARLVFEHATRDKISIEGFAELDRRTWGDTGVTFFELLETPPDV